MPKRKEVFAPGEIYHVYNRAAGAEKIFIDNFYLNEALKRVQYFKFDVSAKYIYFNKYKKQFPSSILLEKDQQRAKPLVEIYSHSIMPNHYHFVLKELISNGLTSFFSKFQMSFARLYNARNNRSGVVFQGRFKSKLISNTEQFIHIVRYVHLNPVTAYLVEFEELSNSLRSSYSEYVNSNKKYNIIDSALVFRQFSSIEKFKSFHRNQVDYQRKLAFIKKILID
jgi:putative transposase